MKRKNFIHKHQYISLIYAAFVHMVTIYDDDVISILLAQRGIRHHYVFLAAAKCHLSCCPGFA